MKVFNTEVNCCNECPMIDRHSDKYLDLKCNLLHRANVSDKNKTISKDCPFNKPITQEIIEGFGFKVMSDYGAGTSYILGDAYKLDTVKYEGLTYSKNQVRIFTNAGIFGEDWSRIFMGTINNPEELKFILSSLNIIS